MGGKSSKMQEISKEDLDYLLKRTDITSKEIKHWYRIYMKECPSGKLTKEQFCKIYAEISPSGKHHKLYEHIFRTYDQDNSGHIDFTEFIEAINVTRSQKPEDKLRMAFRLYDIDQNGCIEEQEMVEVMKDLHEFVNEMKAMTDREVHIIRKKALHTITSGEEQNETDQKITARARLVFERVDKNHDGFVTIDELVQVCMRDPDVYHMVISTAKTKTAK